MSAQRKAAYISPTSRRMLAVRTRSVLRARACQPNCSPACHRHRSAAALREIVAKRERLLRFTVGQFAAHYTARGLTPTDASAEFRREVVATLAHCPGGALADRLVVDVVAWLKCSLDRLESLPVPAGLPDAILIPCALPF